MESAQLRDGPLQKQRINIYALQLRALWAPLKKVAPCPARTRHLNLNLCGIVRLVLQRLEVVTVPLAVRCLDLGNAIGTNEPIRAGAKPFMIWVHEKAALFYLVAGLHLVLGNSAIFVKRAPFRGLVAGKLTLRA